jgi:hypothetical protein
MNQSDLPIYIFGYIIAVIIGIFLTRAIFSIPKFLRLSEAKFQVLVEIAKQQGVSEDVLNSIHTNCGVNKRLETFQENKATLERARNKPEN